MLVFLAVLLLFSVAGAVVRLTSPARQTADRCAVAAIASVRFQSAVTSDLDKHARLHADTDAFVAKLHSLGATACVGTRRFLVAAEETVRGLCADCATRLRRVRLTGA